MPADISKMRENLKPYAAMTAAERAKRYREKKKNSATPDMSASERHKAYRAKKKAQLEELQSSSSENVKSQGVTAAQRSKQYRERKKRESKPYDATAAERAKRYRDRKKLESQFHDATAAERAKRYRENKKNSATPDTSASERHKAYRAKKKAQLEELQSSSSENVKSQDVTAAQRSGPNMMNVALLPQIMKCTNFCAIKHRNQRRKNTEQTPYINHPIGVAYILTEEASVSDPDVIMAALLHDTVEDTDTTFDEIETLFGPKITSIVKEVTDDKSLPKMERKRLQIEHAPTSSHQAKLVKLADKLYNLRDLQKEMPIGWTAERVTEYFLWSHKVIEGLRGTNKTLEDKLDSILFEHVKPTQS